jgi:hypothetical protein
MVLYFDQMKFERVAFLNFFFRTLSMRQKAINLRNQGSFDKKFDFFPQTLSHIPKWVRLVQKKRAKNSHAWAQALGQQIT